MAQPKEAPEPQGFRPIEVTVTPDKTFRPVEVGSTAAPVAATPPAPRPAAGEKED